MNTPDQNVREQLRQILNWYDCSSPRGVDGIAGQTAIDGLFALIDQISAERGEATRVDEVAFMYEMVCKSQRTAPISITVLDYLRGRLAALRQPSGEEGK